MDDRDNLPGPDDPYWNEWHDGDIVEIQVECGLCQRDMGCFSAYLSLVSGYAWEIEIGRDWSENGEFHGAARSVPSGANQTDPMNDRHHRWTLICPGKQCTFRRVVTRERVGAAMVKAWRAKSHRMIAGMDL